MIFLFSNLSLFNVHNKYALAHCISSDAIMAAGVAEIFTEKYPENTSFCRQCKAPVGTAIHFIVNNGTDVYNLVTKRYFKGKPTYTSLSHSLLDLKCKMEENEHTHLAIPRIGCGLDRLQWDLVQRIIWEIFKETEVELLVCTPSQKIKLNSF